MIDASAVIDVCRNQGLTFYTGVPCSLLKPLINKVIQTADLTYVAASIEGEAVAMAAGSWLAGQPAVVMLQNSGLGNVVNPITSLTNTYQIPCLLIVSHRGKPGTRDKIQHKIMGRITEDLLDLMDVPRLDLSHRTEQLNEHISGHVRRGMASSLPTALLLPKGVLTSYEVSHDPGPVTSLITNPHNSINRSCGEVSRATAVGEAVAVLGADDLVISTTGKISRELFEMADRDGNFYMQGSMGCAAGIGLGVALNQKKRVVVLDGDGAALMKMGSLATIGHYQPRRYTHIILDNMSYDSTGGQPSVSSTVSFSGVARACGYRRTASVTSLADFKDCLDRFLPEEGPSLIHMRVKKGDRKGLGRPTLVPEQIRDRFRDAVCG